MYAQHVCHERSFLPTGEKETLEYVKGLAVPVPQESVPTTTEEALEQTSAQILSEIPLKLLPESVAATYYLRAQTVPKVKRPPQSTLLFSFKSKQEKLALRQQRREELRARKVKAAQERLARQASHATDAISPSAYSETSSAFVAPPVAGPALLSLAVDAGTHDGILMPRLLHRLRGKVDRVTEVSPKVSVPGERVSTDLTNDGNLFRRQPQKPPTKSKFRKRPDISNKALYFVSSILQ